MNKSNHLYTVDFIIVGAGSAGCVLANRLSANPDSEVALFEAGHKGNTWKIKMPAALTYNLSDKHYNWFYHTEPQARLNNRCLYWPRGKVLGGSSALNAMVYIRGHAKDYDRWHDEGATGWNYHNVLPYFKRSESYSKGADDYRGDNGPLKVAHQISKNPLFDTFIAAGVEAGYPYTQDVNGAQQEGFGRFDMTINKGMRCSVSDAYLEPRKNLSCFTQACVRRILFIANKAIGIEYVQKGVIKRCYARHEVILSGGAINSPHLLMLSGIGPSQMLAKNNIDVLTDLQGVGSNLHDHLEFYMQYECKKPITLSSVSNPLKRAAVGLQWFLTKEGLAASSHLESGGFIKSAKEVAHPDIQYHFLPGIINNHSRNIDSSHAFQVHVGTMRPESRGHLELASNDPEIPVRIFANYLEKGNDLRDLMKAIPITRDIFNQPAFLEYKGKELQPGIQCRTPKQMATFLKEKIDSAYHPCGTCKMGTDDMAVVNPEAKVHGIDNLRVVDASIMPSIISGNLNAPTIMMAERVSDMILGRIGNNND